MSKKPFDSVIEQTQAALKERDGAQCARCRGSDSLTVDHIIPQLVLDLFGLDRRTTYKMYWLLQILCRKCNALKTSRIDWQDPRSKTILQRLINEL